MLLLCKGTTFFLTLFVYSKKFPKFAHRIDSYHDVEP